MTANPLEEIHHAERTIAAAIEAATTEAATAVAEARRRSEKLIAEARARGAATAEQRYTAGIARARDTADRIRGGAEGLQAALRRGAEPHIATAVDLVMEAVLATSGED